MNDIYKIGKIVSIGKTYVIMEVNYTGSIVYVAKPQDFKKDWIGKIFIYEHRSEYTEALYGFNTLKERIIFENLLGVNGIGPKIALNLLSGKVEDLVNNISSGNTEALTRFPTIGEKLANQIIFELQDSFRGNNFKEEKDPEESLGIKKELSVSLKTLGFNKEQVFYASEKIDASGEIQKLVKDSITLISNTDTDLMVDYYKDNGPKTEAKERSRERIKDGLN